ncbi:MAG: MBOAT family O-acyltransferase, partial [Huintestinicola sp.]
FPQIVAGPIVRYEHVANELENRTVNAVKINSGIGLFVKGLAKKVLIANKIGAVWTSVKAMDMGNISAATAWIGILAFTFQIYFDFSGYSDMATGLGRMMGFEFPINFDHPYVSRSVSEFWRRWHITLGSWFRSYVYIPLGGNRCGTAKTLRNLIIVWALTGLWHGASWNFVLWGLYFGLLIILERLFLGKILEKLPSAISMLYTFLAAVFGWVLFDTDTLSDAGRFFSAMFGGGGSAVDSTAKYLFTSNCMIFAVCILIAGGVGDYIIKKAMERNKRGAMITGSVLKIAGLLVCTAYLVGATYNPFLYFRF